MRKILENKKKTLFWATIPLIILFLLISALSKRLLDIGQGLDPSFIPTVLLDTPAPDFNLPPLPNRGAGLKTSDLQDSISIVNIWGSWCIACLAEHQLLLEISKIKKINLHGIAWRDNPEDSIEWLRSNGDPYNLVGQDPNSEAAIAFGVTGAPETFLIDRKGIIRYKHTGPLTDTIWEQTIYPIIENLQ